MHIFDVRENYAVLDPLKGRLGFGLGLVAGMAIAASWVAKVQLIPSVVAGTTFNLGVGLQTVVYGFVLAALMWGTFFKLSAGFVWAVGLAIGPGLVLGTAGGLDSALGWGLDWQFGERIPPMREDIIPGGLGLGVLAGVMWGTAVGLLVFAGALGVSLGAALILQPGLAALGQRFWNVVQIAKGRARSPEESLEINNIGPKQTRGPPALD